MQQRHHAARRGHPAGFAAREDGALTFLGLSLLLCSIVLGGLSLDVAFAYKARTELQVAADAAAHAALVTRETGTLEEARAAAIRMAQANLPPEVYGEVLTAADIQFGHWDQAAGLFTVDNNTLDTVMVNTTRYSASGNAVPTFLLNFVGIGTWDVRTGAIFETYRPDCLNEGFVAQNIVDMQGNNDFLNGFCIHANEYVSLNNNNLFGAGAIVSMPDLARLDASPSMNPGLAEALRSTKYKLRILDRLDQIIAGLQSADPVYVPDYITTAAPVYLSKTSLAQADFIPGRIHELTCGGGKVSIEKDTVLSDVVVLTDCEVVFGNSVTLENAILATTNPSFKSISSAAKLQIGRNDNCATGGGAQLLTLGGMMFPAQLDVFGGQLLARGDISFAAQATGEGASLVSGHNIDGTSNSSMTFCGSGMEGNFAANYYHLRG